MIIVKLQGGLGNQMFQYALGRALSLRHGVPLKIDYSYLKTPNQSGRVFELDGFNIHAAEATEKEIARYIGLPQKIMDRFVRNGSQKRHVKERSAAFDPSVLTRSDGYFEGFWQDEHYFKTNEKTIREDFSLKEPFGAAAQHMADKMVSHKNATSVHIRRGDFVSIEKIAKVHGTLSLSYYGAACDTVLGKFPDSHFFVSSDDILWAKENFPNKYPATFISSPDISDCEELILMNLCAHNIIANSTMSWWGAWRNRHPDKIVIAPHPWMKAGPEDRRKGPVLAEWHTINT